MGMFSRAVHRKQTFDQDAKVMKVTLHVVVGGGWVRDAGTGEPREVAVDDAGTTTDLYRATVLQRQSQTVRGRDAPSSPRYNKASPHRTLSLR